MPLDSIVCVGSDIDVGEYPYAGQKNVNATEVMSWRENRMATYIIEELRDRIVELESQVEDLSSEITKLEDTITTMRDSARDYAKEIRFLANDIADI